MVHAANERAGYDDAKKDQTNADQFTKDLAKLLCEELTFSASVPKLISDMCTTAGWHTTNTRAGLESDANRDKAQVSCCRAAAQRLAP